ncbi:protease inhibitor I42 family protein [Luteipulveratus sp. YIM 133132]|uniref:protease inhibitor I42 family protein n=1 Tax=Luteipulveratus flavus TaxID=3031728 RepID=UPI0023B18B89|nr:protease inhibitor I42 family protein [Luteipulveratus sp. YIM 133132]MDE9367230.1 protease inhibitor I42 family protein [Luteipulveratus sp. YIM 133132]
MHHVVESPEDGQRIPLAAGDSLEVRLRHPSGTGYRWTVTDLPPGVVVGGDDAQVEAGTSSAPGQARTSVVELVASSPGESVVRLALERPWEDAPLETVSLTLAVS